MKNICHNETDKSLIRQNRHLEALGTNYNSKPIYVMVFLGECKLYKGFKVDLEDPRGKWAGSCVEHLKDDKGIEVNFSSRTEAKEWISKNKEPLPSNMWYCFGNHNSDWL